MGSQTSPETAPLPRLRPPQPWLGRADDFLRALESPWYRLVAQVADTVVRATHRYAHGRGLSALPFPITTRTITCPTGLGSDSVPVPVSVSGVSTYLADSMQFMLEYGCRLTPGGCHTILPSFRGDIPDRTHLSQFMHCEAEIPGDLSALIDYVEGYLRALAQAILDEHAPGLVTAIGEVAHLERMAGADGGFARLTFAEAARLLRREPDADLLVVPNGSGHTFSRAGEHRLMSLVDEFVWVTHFDHVTVAFYQAFADGSQQQAANADLFFGPGEVVGSGQRHHSGEQVRKALALHEIPEAEYAWYVRMKDQMPMVTSGFGLGLERFLLWALRHDDIRDVPLVSRIGESPQWPASVDRP